MNSELLKQGEAVSWVSLGSVSERVFRTNASLKYGLSDVRGVTNTKEIAPTKANVSERALEKFYVVQPEEFVFNRRVHGTGARRLGLGFNSSNRDFIFTEDYVAFSVKKVKILPAFLFLFFCREDFNRYVVTNSWGSATEFFNWDDMCRVKIPLPPIEVQRAYVETYKGLTSLIEENEALLKSLEATTQACVAECREKWPLREVGDFIRYVREKNMDGKITLEQGVNIQKRFIVPQRTNSNLLSRVVVRKGQFAYCTQLNNENVAIALRKGVDCVVSPVYSVFEVTSSELLSEFLLLSLMRSEFGRYVYWASVGSAYEFLTEESMRRYKIPLPPIEVQKAIVALYHCAEEARSIADEARAQLARACPAMIQQAAHRR